MGNGSPSSPADFLTVFREFAALDKRRASSGLSPLDFQRWKDLKGRLGNRFKQRGVGKAAESTPSRLRVEFATTAAFVASELKSLAKGDGMFVKTPFAVPVGHSFVARIHVEETGEELDLPCVVVSSNLGADNTTSGTGMGVRFVALSAERRAQLRSLRGQPPVDPEPESESGAESGSDAESSR